MPALLQLRRVTMVWLLLGTALSACLVSGEPPGPVAGADRRPSWPPSLGILTTHFFDGEHGWAVTPFALLQTRDGGKTWAERFNGGNEDDFLSIAFIDSVRGVIVGGERRNSSHVALFWNTTDGGTTWTKHTDDNISPLSSVSFCSGTTGYATGLGVVVSTSDGGGTWQRRFQREQDLRLMSVACFNSLCVSVVGVGGVILHTDDGGKTWRHEDIAMQGSLLRVRFFGSTGWITGTDGTLLRSRDGGATWERRATGVSNALTDIHLIGIDGWITGSEGTLLRTRDGGETWQKWDSPTHNDLASLFFIDSQHGWACGERLTVLGFTR